MGTILSAWGERTRRLARAADEVLDALVTAAEAKRDARSHTHTHVFLHLENPMGLPRGDLERSRVGSRG